jgi:NAD(P)-dependent dehydrogenase (short-subunit alcohol dehydrogenase family)/acyl carrier protein
VALPVYPFHGKPYWVKRASLPFRDNASAIKSEKAQKQEINNWFYIPSWKRSPLPFLQKKAFPKKLRWLVFMDDYGLGARWVERLKANNQDVIAVEKGESFEKTGEQGYRLNPGDGNHYDKLFLELSNLDKFPDNIVHFWSVTGGKEIDESLETGYYSLFYLARAVGRQDYRAQIQITVISDNLQSVTGQEELCPGKSTVLGMVKVIAKEYVNIRCRSIDIILPPGGGRSSDRLLNQLQDEFLSDYIGTIAAYRGENRWHEVFEPLRLERQEGAAALLKGRGCYLITGGLGGIGLELAGFLAREVQAKLVLTGRRGLPPGEKWDSWLTSRPDDDPVSRKIRKVREIEKNGAEVLIVEADVTDETQMKSAVSRAAERFGHIDGVIHAAGVPDGGVIPLRTREATDRVLAPKLQGTRVLERVLKDTSPDFFMLCSSLRAILGPYGQVGDCAANIFMDTFAQRKTAGSGIFTMSVNWDVWKDVGMAVDTLKQLEGDSHTVDSQSLLEHGISSSQGADVFNILLHAAYSRVVVSTRDLNARFNELKQSAVTGPPKENHAPPPPSGMRPRPLLNTEYAAPETVFEKKLAGILTQFLGISQVGINDSFFELGINSLSMIHVNNLLKRTIGKDIPIVVFFEYPTIHALEQYLDRLENQGDGKPKKTEKAQAANKANTLLFNSMNMLRNKKNG